MLLFSKTTVVPIDKDMFSDNSFLSLLIHCKFFSAPQIDGTELSSAFSKLKCAVAVDMVCAFKFNPGGVNEAASRCC
jgi:hypothetical protein